MDKAEAARSWWPLPFLEVIMKNEIPAPIKEHLLKLKIALIVFGTIGLLLGIICSDQVILMLTGLIVAGGVAMLWHLTGIAERGEYDVVSGVVLSFQRLHRKNKLVLMCDDGAEQALVLSGRPTFTAGVIVTLYLSKLDSSMRDISLPEPLMPAQIVLGVEKTVSA